MTCCPRCGLETPDLHHLHDDCIRDLRRCHEVAKRALLKIHAIAKKLHTEPSSFGSSEKLVEDALHDLNITCP